MPGRGEYEIMKRQAFRKWVLKSEKGMMLLELLLSALEDFLMSFLFFDKKGIESLYGVNQITGRDYALISVLGITGITRQTYFFAFLGFLLFHLAFFLVWNHIAYRGKKKDLLLFYVKGYSRKETSLRLCGIRTLLHLLLSVGSLLLSSLFCLLFFALVPSDHMLILPNLWYLLPFVLDNLTFALTGYLTFGRKTKTEDVLRYLRENY